MKICYLREVLIKQKIVNKIVYVLYDANYNNKKINDTLTYFVHAKNEEDIKF